MAKMVPNYIDQDDLRLDGERMVFDWLSSEEVPGFALHSLLQKNQKRKLIGEVDFLYISPRGILCIEVKGGEIFRKDGLWYSRNKKSIVNEIKDPFRQAKDCMYAVRTYLKDIYGQNATESNCLLGYAVIFPECRCTATGNDLITEVLFDAKWSLTDFPIYLEEVFNYWQAQEEEKHYSHPPKPNDMLLRKYLDLFRGDFHVVPSMNLEMQHINQKMIELTEEQYDTLDITLTNKNVIIQGGAGTGKSILAVEKARKLMAANRNVAYICFNHNMAQYAQNAFETIPKGSFVGTYHSLLIGESSGVLHFDSSIFERIFKAKGIHPPFR